MDQEKLYNKNDSKASEMNHEMKALLDKYHNVENQLLECKQELSAVVAARAEHMAELDAARRSIGSLSMASERLKEREEELHKIRIKFEERVAELAREAKLAVTEEIKKRETSENEATLKVIYLCMSNNVAK